jgi:non-homologous end joining protein Ku
MKSICKGSIAFGLVNIPVKLVLFESLLGECIRHHYYNEAACAKPSHHPANNVQQHGG